MAGPTGSGKSSVAIELARILDGEVIGADAFQVYRGLPVLTAHPSPVQMACVRHHLIGFVPLDSGIDAARWLAMARGIASDIMGRGKTAILAGGTGLYLKAFTHGLAEIPPPSPALRGRLSTMSREELLCELAGLDPDAVSSIDTNNPVRLRRAIEIITATGRPLAESRREWDRPARRLVDGVVIHRESHEIGRRIASNVDAMFEAGVIDEVRSAGAAGPAAARAIGYREIGELIAGRTDVDGTRRAIVGATRRYARRQATWCRNQFDLPLADLTGIEDPRTAAEVILAILRDSITMSGPMPPRPPIATGK